ncbi:MAG: ABC transporter ATP-binding protein [Desulfobacula sp.]|uniref:ABC transporter ATP-binding protein n=2 Tax=Desulfobacula sp. TaxID=2593537 RepID=UPI001EBC48E8|nr:ABC transporter ATP-binding protein [Desulfobacula sp.]
MQTHRTEAVPNGVASATTACTEPNDALVQFIEVQKSYDGKILVVKDLNLDVARGEFLTMLGPSGSGKTTCLMILAGFEPTTNGKILLNGRSINDVPPHKRDIGMVFQNYALFPHMTVAENLAFPLKVRKVPAGEVVDKVNRALEMVKLQGFDNRRPAQLSGGQQQRVAVARALVFEPDLVLMDEPLGALDKQLREQMQYEIKHIHENLGITTVYVTHDQAEALTMSDRIAVFNDGVVQQLATPADLYEKPENDFVAGFIGENNRFYGTVSEVNGSTCTVKLDENSTVTAEKVDVGGVGARATLSIRPERVELLGQEGSMANRLSGRIEELIYLGDHIRVRMTVAGNDEFIVKVRNSANMQYDLKEGDEINVGWNTKDCRALKPIDD